MENNSSKYSERTFLHIFHTSISLPTSHIGIFFHLVTKFIITHCNIFRNFVVSVSHHSIVPSRIVQMMCYGSMICAMVKMNAKEVYLSAFLFTFYNRICHQMYLTFVHIIQSLSAECMSCIGSFYMENLKTHVGAENEKWLERVHLNHRNLYHWHSLIIRTDVNGMIRQFSPNLWTLWL